MDLQETKGNLTANCKVCGKSFRFYQANHKGLYCSRKCRYEDHSNIIKNSYTPELKELKRKLAIEQMKDSKQIEIRKKNCGWEMTEEQKERLSEVKTKNSFLIAKKIILKEQGNFCQRCGKEFDQSALLIHHKNGRKWDNDIENLQVLCKSCHSKIHNEFGKLSHRFAGLATVENYIAKVLVSLGIDIDQPDFKETPLRVARMYAELFEGTKSVAQEELKEIFKTKFPCENDNMVVIKGLKIFSLCPHHLVPVEYDMTIGYIPKKFVLGLSKPDRVAEILAHRPVLQETLTVEIAKAIQENLDCLGVGVVIKGRHFCMIMRGIKQVDSSTTTSHLIGVFRDQDSTRQEFLNL